MSASLQTVRVRHITQETPSIVSIDLAPVESDRLPAFEAGAHIDLHLPNGLVRSYSLMSCPSDLSHYRLGVLHDRRSRGGSAFIHKHLRAGALLKASAPRNNFPTGNAARAVFIAGGIGITPLLSMARQLAGKGAAVELLYCSRSEGEVAFRGELEGLQGAVTYHFDDQHGGAPDLKTLMRDYPRDTHFYCCGPVPMLEAFDQACTALGIKHRHTERFCGAALSVSGTENRGFEVVLARSGKQLYHDGKGSLVDTLVASGQIVSYSCKEGVCGACETGVLEGTPEHRDFVLSTAERASGKTMMICVSGCKSDRLVLDL
ncbi:PDR/VanB family oxidoreductase [Pseudomonas gingeri]|uniref:PDR/VanB family oxidoreductase n=1 Tax=Pseudomonas gingeri TaxID=117681 RepID=UPI0015A0E658|nr:PDR/VanB family oxidoreductase [Pseudomonas gingeri]NWA03135.1 oxidoreductase [Pseudomonas gingeri]NWA18357.1 oxidoreductase [Pseudomonas gingeri]NWA53176.1 oxidoreductase [Pseudomonas gingeri]NWA99008.1 oxidoreductase [Pseudomonas gingeri]NWB02342.1 oxidoreductase [Pseudomonas gingeri]